MESTFMWSGFEFRGYYEKQRIDRSSNIIFRVTGKERTGTNYINTMIKCNFPETNFYIHKFGGKHGLPPRWNKFPNPLYKKELKNKKFICVLTIKNPYTWVNSIGAWKPNYRLDKWFPRKHILRYKSFYRQYKYMLEKGCNSNDIFNDVILVRYEDMLKNEEAELNRISKKFGIPYKNNVRNPEIVPFSKPFPEERKLYYLEQKPQYGKRLIRKINELLDWDVMKFYGYEKIEV